MRMFRSLPLLLAIALLPDLALAKKPENPWHMDIEVRTEFPLMLGGRVGLEMPLRLRASTSLGVLPGGYVDLADALLRGLGAYDDDTGDLITSSFADTLVWNVRVGWRPFPERGFYFELGYQLVALGGTVTNAELMERVTNEVPEDPRRSAREYVMDSTLHMLSAEIGWEWILGGYWIVRVAGGMASTVGSSTKMGYRYVSTGRQLHDDFTADAEDFLDSLYPKVVHVPFIAVGVGLRLF